MEEASTFQVGRPLRALFVTLILDGTSAPKLWREFKDNLIEDFVSRMPEEEAIQESLKEIDLKLQLHGKLNTQANLPNAIHSLTEFQRMKNSFNSHQSTEYAESHGPRLTSE